MGSPSAPSSRRGDGSESLSGNVRFQAKACKLLGSPLYALLLSHAATDVEEKGPTWDVLRGHERDPRASALALRLMGAVNRLVLNGEEPTLAKIYRDPQRDETLTWREFKTVLERNASRLKVLVNRPVQTNEVGRCAALLPGFLKVAGETGMPLRLLEVGASAGLNLRWDRYRYVSDEMAWGPPDSPVEIAFELQGHMPFPVASGVEVAERRGCDTAPIDPTTTMGELDLLAYIWPDQPDRIERLRAALDVARQWPVAIERADATAWVRRSLHERAPGRATVIFHSIVEQYLSAEELAAFHRHVRDAGERSTAAAPLAWLRMEPAGDRAEVWLTTWPGGRDRRLAHVGYHGALVSLLA